MKLIIISALLSATTVLATVNGRCAGSYNDGVCICLNKATCTKYADHEVIVGTKGNYPCPYDSADVVGCKVGTCVKAGIAGCSFNDYCAKYGHALSNPTCPGGANFVCCQYEG